MGFFCAEVLSLQSAAAEVFHIFLLLLSFHIPRTVAKSHLRETLQNMKCTETCIFHLARNLVYVELHGLACHPARSLSAGP